MAVDGSNLYWADFQFGTIFEDKNVPTGGVPAIIVSGQAEPYGVAVDGSNLLWADSGTGTIMEANLDGTNPQPPPPVPRSATSTPGLWRRAASPPRVLRPRRHDRDGGCRVHDHERHGHLVGRVQPGPGRSPSTLYGPSPTANCRRHGGGLRNRHPHRQRYMTTPIGFSPTQAGNYWWTASYGGDPGNNPAASNCGDESVTVTAPVLYVATDGSDSTGTGSCRRSRCRRSRPRSQSHKR